MTTVSKDVTDLTNIKEKSQETSDFGTGTCQKDAANTSVADMFYEEKKKFDLEMEKRENFFTEDLMKAISGVETELESVKEENEVLRQKILEIEARSSQWSGVSDDEDPLSAIPDAPNYTPPSRPNTRQEKHPTVRLPRLTTEIKVQLIDNMKKQLKETPKPRSYQTALRKLSWDLCTFDELPSGDMCQAAWKVMSNTRKVRKHRTLQELIDDVELLTEEDLN